ADGEDATGDRRRRTGGYLRRRPADQGRARLRGRDRPVRTAARPVRAGALRRLSRPPPHQGHHHRPPRGARSGRYPLLRQRPLRHRHHARRPQEALQRGDLLDRRDPGRLAEHPGDRRRGLLRSRGLRELVRRAPRCSAHLAARGGAGRRDRQRQRGARHLPHADQARGRSVAHRDPGERLRGAQGEPDPGAPPVRTPRPEVREVHSARAARARRGTRCGHGRRRAGLRRRRRLRRRDPGEEQAGHRDVPHHGQVAPGAARSRERRGRPRVASPALPLLVEARRGRHRGRSGDGAPDRAHRARRQRRGGRHR
uniref:UDP-glucose 4-epimerase n=1 Tax=Parastrongyloides trichosuri TaxID=131310 RepID=A0A0N5A0T2_PARTI